MKQINIKIAKGKDGEYGIQYEVEGYSGIACDEVATVLSSLGSMSDKKTTDSAYQQEIPVPVPVQHS